LPSVNSVASASDQDTNALLSGVKWAPSAFPSFPGETNLTFSFPASASFYGSYGEETTNGFAALTPTQQAAARAALNLYSSVSNLTFTEITETSSVHADLRFGQSNAPSTAWAYYPSTSPYGGDAWFNRASGAYADPEKGSYAYHTFMHEIGHSLGLKHGHQTATSLGGGNFACECPDCAGGSFTAAEVTPEAGAPRDSAIQPAMTYAHDSMEFSVMTYNAYVGDAGGGYPNEDWGFAQSLMMYDIAAIQHMYGADYQTRSSNTTYRWDAATGEQFVDGVAQGAPGGNRIFMTVWDGGGVDTYDFSNYGNNLVVDLAPGSWTTTAGDQLAQLSWDGMHAARGNIANALLDNGDLRSLVENATGGWGHDRVSGNQGDNVLLGNAGDDTLAGGGGADSLEGGAGADLLDGGEGSDTAVFLGALLDYDVEQLADGSVRLTDRRVSGDQEADTLGNVELFSFLSSGQILTIEELLGGAAPQSWLGTSGADTIVLGSGGDWVDAGEGDDGVWGGLGNDTAMGRAGADYMVGRAGNDGFWGGDGGDALVGDGGADYLAGENGCDVLVGGDGNDAVTGGEDEDYLAGEAGNDVLVGGAGHDAVNGGEGDDYLAGDAGNDVLVAGAGHDAVNGGEGDDYLTGEAGDDVLVAGAGYDAVNGGEGDDYMAGEGDGDVLVAGSGQDGVNGGDGDDYLAGEAGHDVLIGGEGYDAVNGGDGDDYLAGEAGDDVLVAGEGRDALNGGGGDDYLAGEAGHDALVAGDGDDAVNGGEGDDYLAGEEGCDVLIAGAGDDGVNGGGGEDYLAGEAGWDVLVAGAGHDTLSGGEGDDYLAGEAGDDLIEGGAGNDLMEGGAGDDTFVFAGDAGYDTILGFEAGRGGDVLEFGGGAFGDFDAVMAHTHQSGGEVIIYTGEFSSIVLTGLQKSDLSADDFRFV